MGKTCHYIFFLALIIPLSSCQSFSLDKERATEQRKQELCGQVSTRNQPQCSGSGTSLPGVTSEMIDQLETAGISIEVLRKQVLDEIARQKTANALSPSEEYSQYTLAL